MSKRITQEYSFTVLYEPADGDERQGYQVTVPRLPGVITYGRTFEEARVMARDAIECYLESLRSHKEPIPTEDVVLQERVTVRF